jgi:hypothetical protein
MANRACTPFEDQPRYLVHNSDVGLEISSVDV